MNGILVEIGFFFPRYSKLVGHRDTGMPSCIDDQRFRVLEHLLILVFVPDPFPYPRSYICHLQFANEQIQVEEH